MHGAPVPGAGEIHLWYCRDADISDHGVLALYASWLSAEEQQRQARFLYPRHRHRYLLTRALVRNVLSGYCPGTALGDWQFAANAHGKPHIAAPDCGALNFNLSHTKGMIVMAVSCARELGVDVEWTGRQVQVRELAAHSFAAGEVGELADLDEAGQRSRFVDFWTLKEAYIKACGLGLALPLDQFCFSLRQEGRIDLAFDSPIVGHADQWALWLLEAGAQHRVALAIANAGHADSVALTVRETVPGLWSATREWPLIRRS
jgi:4'-phosphopantetheinyl transferase